MEMMMVTQISPKHGGREVEVVVVGGADNGGDGMTAADGADRFRG